MRKEMGFTLLEIMVALFIFAIVATIATTGLHQVITQQHHLQQRMNHLRTMQKVWLFIKRDLEQISNRTTTNPQLMQEPAIYGTSTMLTLLRNGYQDPNPLQLQSHLEKVRYQRHTQTLERLSTGILDPVKEIHWQKQHLLSISEITFRYLDQNNHFFDQWPPPTQVNGELPKAIEVTLTLLDSHQISQLFLIRGLG